MALGAKCYAFGQTRGFSCRLRSPNENAPFRGRLHLDGGEGGIRTLDTLLTYTPLAGERLQPLGHFSKFSLLRLFSNAPFALPGRALLGAVHLALRVAVVPPALLRSP